MEGGGSRTTHGAADSALGYLYQSELALLELVQRSKYEPSLALSIELLDDVSFEEAGLATELLQAKHHLRSPGSLSDASADVWRTLAVWMDSITSGAVDADTTRFSIATTTTAPDGSAASFLRADDARDANRALGLLERTARTSQNASLQPAYQQFLGLGEERRSTLISAVTVYDGSPTIVDIPAELEVELRFASEARFRQAIVERLVGWWHRRVVGHLVDRDTIYAEELEQEIDALRDQFKADNLPIDIRLEDVEAGDDLSAEDRVFIRQLQLIAATLPTIELAIRDYKRAFMQRSRWISDQLVTDAELRGYEERLIDEWQHQYSYLGELDGSDDDGMRTAGLNLYRRLQDNDLWIRPRCQERFISRGSYHELADQKRVGWHPQFVAKLREVLESTST